MKLWFRAKTYGYGWTPCSWQGWLILASYIALTLVTFLSIDSSSHSASDTLMNVIPLFVLYTLLLVLMCIKKGEKPRWRWGRDKL